MKMTVAVVAAALVSLASTLNAAAEVRYVDLNCATPAPPFTNWTTAATNIQDAIDLAADGDVIWVTNGVYASGGKVMVGDLTNRVALDKAVMVQSVNGPQETAIQGSWDAVSTNGPGAVRCAWLTNGAVLSGFTLRGGATRSSGASATLLCGGGVWCASTNAGVANCIITGNSAASSGAGSYYGSLSNCALTSNLSSSGGGGSYYGTLNNCTLTGNRASSGGGASYGTLNNCIVWGNVGGYSSNYNSSTLSYTCASPLAAGEGNIAVDPQLLADGVHIAATSPCRDNGNALYANGADIDGQPWANPPPMGCDQWQPQPMVMVPPRWQLAAGVDQSVEWKVIAAGQEPFDCWWTKDGVAIQDGGRYGGAQTTTLLVRGFGPDDAGAYQVVVSNAFGVATSPAARLVVHCADAAATTPLIPYTNWAAAAVTIQAAIDAASPGALILVTNGVYATGGKAMAGDLTNRVALNKAVVVWSVNGPQLTVVQGQWNPGSTNGLAAVRCAWLTNGAVLSGFTLRGGATRASADSATLGSGGGVWCASTDAVVANCVITSNSAFSYGAGAYLGTLNNCTLTGNSSFSHGGGSYYGTLNNCTLTGNLAGWEGGGCCFGTLNNCTVTGNSASLGGGSYSSTLSNCALTSNTATSNGGGSCGGTLNNCTLSLNSASLGGGSYFGTLNNCIVWNNGAFSSGPNCYGGTLRYTCASPLAEGEGNIAGNPQLLADGVHIAATSPCRTNGNPLYASGTDIDGQPWTNPPSMGCDEWQPQPLIMVPPKWQLAAGVGQSVVWTAVAAGQGPFACWWTKDGVAVEDGARYGGAHTTDLLVREFGPDDAGAYQVVVSNALGLVTSPVARLMVHCVDAAATTPLIPYTNWAAAAVTIQAAIDAAAPGAMILVTNGVYTTGGKVMAGNLTNRVALNKAVVVCGINGPKQTVIEGQWDAANRTGPGAVRCAWVADGAVLSGFTLRGGATRATGDSATLLSGGGVWCVSTNAVVANCVITRNYAYQNGGGAYSGTLNHCTLFLNRAYNVYSGNKLSGGGSYSSTLNNCALTGNHATDYGGGSYSGTLNNCTLSLNWAAYGGGSYSSTLNNCTLTGNSATINGGGSNGGTLNNCIVWGNVGASSSNYYSSALSFTCTSPLAAGEGNIATDPQLLADGVHIAATSPCRTNGNPLYASGTDLDDQAWANITMLSVCSAKHEIVPVNIDRNALFTVRIRRLENLQIPSVFEELNEVILTRPQWAATSGCHNQP